MNALRLSSQICVGRFTNVQFQESVDVQWVPFSHGRFRGDAFRFQFEFTLLIAGIGC